jgi:hypothetical protein
LGAGYVFGYFDGLNRFYVREEDRHLLERFRLPPGVFDEIENLSVGLNASARDESERREPDRAKEHEEVNKLRAKVEAL